MLDISTKKAGYVYLQESGTIVNREISHEFADSEEKIASFFKLSDKEIFSRLARDISNAEIDEIVAGCDSIVLGITEACNLRCNYCSYSGDYTNHRQHSGSRMSVETAKAAIDFFLGSVVNTDPGHSMNRNRYFGFYGGESLLEFDLTKRIYEYSQKQIDRLGLRSKFDFKYLITTNGYLLGEPGIVDFITANNIRIDVSMDGPKKEHDKFRVTAAGKGTWDKINENLVHLKENHPEYYDKFVGVLVTLHPSHNGASIDNFFREPNSLIEKEKVSINLVNKLYINAGKQDDFKVGGSPACTLLLEKEFEQLENTLKYIATQQVLGFTMNCFPGQARIFVDTAGMMQPCERVSHQMPKIGSVHEGLFYDNIRKILHDYAKEIVKNRCWECPIRKTCPVCVANAYDGTGYTFPCKDNVEPFRKSLKAFLTAKEEKDDKKYDSMPDDFYSFMDRL
ncbi:MAG: radical SAM protein [bacterium]|nr:radical SAM protein [bacterium]